MLSLSRALLFLRRGSAGRSPRSAGRRAGAVRARAAALVGLALLTAGCITNLVADNLDSVVEINGTTVRATAGAIEQTLPDVPNTLWLLIDRPESGRTVGAFLSPEPAPGLVVLLCGASTLDPKGRVEAVRRFDRSYGTDLRAAGFRTLSPVLSECHTPYGGEDLADARAVVDWLAAGGAEFLGAERVYVVGYSTGATVVNLLNAERRVTAMVSLAGLSEPDQLEFFQPLYRLLTLMFPDNTGFCQLATTLDVYGPPGRAPWSALDAVDRVAEFRNPTLFVHGTSDFVYVVDNTRHLEAQYAALLRAGRADLPPLEFVYVPGGSHFDPAYGAGERQRVIAYLKRFEPG